jgi:hypothetical protein
MSIRLKEERNIPLAIKRRKASWSGHILDKGWDKDGGGGAMYHTDVNYYCPVH